MGNSINSIRLDFLVIAAKVLPKSFEDNQPLSLIIEAKAPNVKLDPHDQKLNRYLQTLKLPYGILTNGRELRVYERKSQHLNLVFQCAVQELEEKFGELRSLVGREELLKRWGLSDTEVTTQPQPLEPIASTGSDIPQDDRPPNIPPKPQPFSNQSISKGQPSMKVIAIYHNKGGVGKTTTTVNLAAALAKTGYRVLLIDLDSQSNSTFAVGLMKFPDEIDDDIKNSYVYHVILEKNKFPISEVARKSSFCTPEFDVIPSHIDLMAHEFELKESTGAIKTRLLKKLEEVAGNYDIVLIDTPPSLNLYAEIALITADYLLIPSDLKPFANEGLNNVRRFISDINEDREDRGRVALEVLGILPSKIPTFARFVDHTLPKMEKTVEERYGYKVLNSRICERRDASAAIEKTIIVGNLDIPDPQSVLDFKPDSASAFEFKKLAEEVTSLIGL